ncbi:MAG: hypothetical protein MUO58_09050 [Anaerolineales bacterium]|nr:hypothetical protein [Anaerolineales bacterium]
MRSKKPTPTRRILPIVLMARERRAAEPLKRLTTLKNAGLSGDSIDK